ncbi:MAG: hypothetical protein GY866_27435 [Proteobacteria bacterium]|nr:hypothetical protein [Pseudomonadota bacterium]
MATQLLKMARVHQAPATLAKRDVHINLGFMAGQQPGAFNYQVESDKYGIGLGELLKYSLDKWSKTRTSTIQSLDELSKGRVEVYLNTRPVTNKSLEHVFSEPEKYDLLNSREEVTDQRARYDIKLVCLVSQTGGGTLF